MMNQPKHIYTECKTPEHIHHTNEMTSISAIGTNHAKIFTGLKDSRPCNKLAESKGKKWSNMARFYMLLTSKDPKVTVYQL